MISNKALITGSTGFVGQNLCNYLEDRSCQIFTLSLRSTHGLEEFTRLLRDVDAVIHLAGKAHDVKDTADEKEYYDTNFVLTQELFKRFLVSNAKKFIFISSVKAVSDSPEEVLTESSRPDPRTPYGKSKLMAEDYILSQSLPADKSIYILRPCMIHGPGNKGNLNLLYNVVSKGIPYPLASFNNRRSFLSVANLCFVISELIARNDIPSGVYQVADDEPLSTNELVTLLAEVQGRSPRLMRVPKKIIRFLAHIGSKLYLPLNTERLKKLTGDFVVNNHKIKAVLKKPLPLSSREGIVLTARSFQNVRQ